MRRWQSARLWCGLAPKVVYKRPQRRACLLSSLGACGYRGRCPRGEYLRAESSVPMTLTCSSLAAACSAELDAGTWSSTLTRRNRLHVDVGAWRDAGVAEVRPSVALFYLREGARVATAREGAAGRRLGEVGQLAVAALALSSQARTRRRSSRSCPATDTTGVIRMRAAWPVELQVLRGYGRPEACVASSPLTLNSLSRITLHGRKGFLFRTGTNTGRAREFRCKILFRALSHSSSPLSIYFQ